MIETQEDHNTNPPPANQPRAIVQHCAKYVLDLFNQKADSRLTYHNYQHTAAIAQRVQTIANAEDNLSFPPEAVEVALLAAWLRNTGYLFNYETPEVQSIQVATTFLDQENYSAPQTEQVIQCIQATRTGAQATSPEAQLLIDAINGQQYTEQYFNQIPLLRLEWELIQNRYLSALDWHQIQLQLLLNTRFYTPYAKINLEPLFAKNLLAQKSKLEKSRRGGSSTLNEEERTLRKFQELERKLPADATQTFFRANYRNHINLSAIADNKANIMISVNAILISVLISLLTYKNITETNPMVLLPVIIFLFTGLTSLIFAVLSSRPKVTSVNDANTDPEQIKRNIVFFGNFVQLDLATYEEAMDAMFRDGELIYGNMVRDLYFLGKVLDKKYRYLTLSYNTFMIGFIATVATFLIAIFS